MVIQFSFRTNMRKTGFSLALVLVQAAISLVNSASTYNTQPSTRMSLSTTGEASTIKPITANSVDPGLQKTFIYRNADCSLIANSESGKEKINKYLQNQDVKLIRYIFKIDDTKTMDTTSSKLYRPMFWARTFSAQGLGVLLLGEMYEVLSFRLLAIGIQTLTIHLSQKPAGCLQGKTELEIEQLLRLAILSDLKMPSSANNSDFKGFKGSQHICNQHALTDSGILNLSYYCCTVDKDNQLVCEYLTYTIWMMVIFWVAMILPGIVVLFLPNYLPKSIVESKKLTESLTYRLSENKVLCVTKITSKDQIDEISKDQIDEISKDQIGQSQKYTVIKMETIKDMAFFSKTVSKLEVNRQSRLPLQYISCKVPNEDTFTKEHQPIGLWDVFRRQIINCRLRKSPYLEECCETKLCSTSVKWYMLLKVVMKFLFAIIVFAPVLVHIAIFFYFEYKEVRAQKKTANEHSVDFVNQNGLTVHVPLSHPIYITACAVFGLNTIGYCLVSFFCKNSLYDTQFIVKSCLNGMMNDMANRGMFLRNSTKTLGVHISRYGILGLMVVLLLVVLLAPFWIAYLLPLVNLLFRLLYVIVLAPGSSSTTKIEHCRRCLANSEDDSTKKTCGFCCHFVQWFFCIFAMVTIGSLVLITYDCICFYVDIVMYTFIGLIINFDAAAAFVSLFVLVMFYGQRCYGSVYEKNAAFFEALLHLCTKQANSYKQKSSHTEKLIDLQPALCQNDDNNDSLLVTANKNPRWKIKGASLLINNKNEPCLPTKIYYEACNVLIYERNVLLQYIKAMIEFILILVFLSFVMVIVLAFGDDYHLSTTNKTLVAVMGGVVPFLLTKFVFKNKNTPNWDVENPSFHSEVNKVLHSYEDRWLIDDIAVENPSLTRSDETANTPCVPIIDEGENMPAMCLYILDEHGTSADACSKI
ncbi:uncharacterized protein LOC128203536 [Mya arenaria]|uniref:uncharacterized protein LOC128203536 n=1 Tax=Mya arenaria TaxID=6604 RepID=UPI0022E0D61E|nr:uncharacterized protein LOC128203536 [Mya arenaria]